MFVTACLVTGLMADVSFAVNVDGVAKQAITNNRSPETLSRNIILMCEWMTSSRRPSQAIGRRRRPPEHYSDV